MLDQFDDESVASPGHQLAEVASAIARLDRAGELPVSIATALTDAGSLPQQVHPLDEQLLRRALDLRGRIRVVDGLYVALAERLDATLLTTDRRLAGADPPCVRVSPPTDR